MSFLAALEIDRNPEKYFGNVERLREARFQEVTVPAFVPIAALERALKIDRQRLRELNPALLRSVWDGQRHVPKAYHLRLPVDASKWTSDALARLLTPGEQYAGQPAPRRYRVRPGDTVASLAEQLGVTPEALARLNRMRTSARLHAGRVINLPETSGALLASNGATPSATSSANRTGQTTGAATAVSPAATTAPATSSTTSAPPPASTSASPGTASSPRPGTTAAEAGAGAAETSPTVSVVNTYVVQRGDSLAEIAGKFGMTEGQLLKLNGIRSRDFVFEGQQLQVTSSSLLASNRRPAPSPLIGPSEGEAAAANTVLPTTSAPSVESLTGAAAEPAAAPVVATGAVPAAQAERESAEEAAAVATSRGPAENAQPVSAAQAEALSPALGPAADTQQNADPTDYSVGKDGTISVAAAETLGHYADWLGISAARLRQVNRMRFGRPVLIGHRLKLDFARVHREEFEHRRREYHQALQASYFAGHRIIGTEIYIVRRGDSLWTVTQRFAQLPIWLLQQYNPDVDLADLHPGTQIVMPRVEVVVAGPA